MLGHLWHLLCRSFAAIPGSLGSNWLGLVFPIGLVIVGEIIAGYLFGWPVVIANWKKATGIGFAAIGVCYTLLFCECVVRSVYDDHSALVAKVREQKAAMRLGDPRIRARIVLTTDGSFDFEGRKHQFVWAGVEIVNPDGPPSSLGGMRMYLSDNGQVVSPENLIMPSVDKVPITTPKGFAGNKTLALRDANECVQHEEPIPTGGRLTCWVWSSFTHVPRHAQVVVVLTDVRSGKSTKLFSEVK